ncbi:hypothetical protein ASPWEDRAFT_108466 [Aspergillus wentii DTO 134E9]|uniref:DUF1996 domain-containing protein n=1 Tax=Aspergillus wentii DTO 134E9 TaxID=1073089 RepID=A0A1L9RMY9_ASPWE|nr:uncharacterized protein ASPWEDRAFT_108466 [Aspergillus wentii DTO 134E9]KAI9925966.1 hypothetical protein MW887_004425 [Aspergillus wentii]OJJ36296.1 hypothetical protein ASPWEDRAFT_108466 [Aspergillus wentii DTO 134E9]
MHATLLSSALAIGLAQAYTVTNSGRFMYKNIDPIVLPGQYTSHMHSFFGSDAVNINTTTSADLQKGCISTENLNDFSTYWVPTLYHVDGDNYTAISPYRFSAYYERTASAEMAIPQNLKMVAGNYSATSQDGVDSNAGITWFCEGSDSGDKDGDAAFPTKTCDTHMQTLLLFPDCANNKTLEYAYSGNPDYNPGYRENRCPKDMYRIPRLRFSIRYDLRKILPDGWSGPPPLQLSSGSSYSTHGDFIMGWLPEAADNMVKDAPSNDREYFRVLGPNDIKKNGSVCTNATDSDPSHGTSDYLTSLKMMGKSMRRHLASHRRGHY